jgi:hypothetical protein
MNETALRNGCNAARTIIHRDLKPANVPQQAAVEDALLGFREALKDIGDRSVYQAIGGVLAKHTLAGCPLFSRVPKQGRPALVGRIARAFALAHLGSLAAEHAAICAQVHS